MKLEKLLQNKLSINGIWIDSYRIDENRHRFWLESAKKKYKVIRYKTKNGVKEVLFPKNVKIHEILALYIKEMYGDGFFYSPIIIDGVTSYYLICIKDDCIISPVDTVISKNMLEYILKERSESSYASLDVKIINEDIFSTIFHEYKNQNNKHKKKLLKISGLVVLSIILFFIFILSFIYIEDQF